MSSTLFIAKSNDFHSCAILPHLLQIISNPLNKYCTTEKACIFFFAYQKLVLHVIVKICDPNQNPNVFRKSEINI